MPDRRRDFPECSFSRADCKDCKHNLAPVKNHMGYWSKVAKRAGKEAAAAAGLGASDRVIASLVVQALIALAIYLMLGQAGLEAAAFDRIIIACAPFLAIPILFGWKMITVPGALANEEKNESQRLQDALDDKTAREGVVSALSVYLEQGEEIKWRCRDGEFAGKEAAEAWGLEVYSYLRNSLPPPHYSQFYSDAGLGASVIGVGMQPGSEAASTYQWLNRRLSRLNSIIDKVG